MPILLAVVPPSRPAADGAAPATDPTRESDFDRHLDAAECGDGGPVADRGDGSAPSREPRASDARAEAMPGATEPSPPAEDAPADRAVAEVLALLMPVAMPTPPPVDPLADAPALPLTTLPIPTAAIATVTPTMAAPLAGTAPTAAPATAPVPPAPMLPSPMADGADAPALPVEPFSDERSITAIDGMATAASVPMTPGIGSSTQLPDDGAAMLPPASEALPVEPAAEAPVDSVLAMLAAVAAAPEPVGDSAVEPLDPAANAARAVASEPAVTAAPLPSQRPRNQAFERDAAPKAVLPDSEPAPSAAPATAVEASTGVAPAHPATPERQPAQVRSDVVATAPTTETEAGRAANAMDRAVAGQVSRAMLTRGAGGERMLVLRLTPPELGTVRVEIIERAGVLSARIHAEDDAVRVALERSLPQMRQDLRAHDAPVREVSLADAWNGFANRQGRNDAHDGRQRQRRDDGAPAFAVDGISAAAAPSSGLALGGIANALGVDARA